MDATLVERAMTVIDPFDADSRLKTGRGKEVKSWWRMPRTFDHLLYRSNCIVLLFFHYTHNIVYVVLGHL
jgi:hypothetical protein